MIRSLTSKVAAMLVIEVEINTIVPNFNVNSWATKCLSKVAWDLYLVRYRRVALRLTRLFGIYTGVYLPFEEGQGVLVLHT